MSQLKSYLGDGVYADFDGNMLCLTTENGMPSSPQNTIYLEDTVYKALLEYVKGLSDRRQQLAESDDSPGYCEGCGKYHL
jgi:hypothetical protein